MLNLENIRDVSKKMMTEARAKTEAFWQNVFDNLHFDKNHSMLNSYAFYGYDDCPEEFCEFQDLDFIISISCLGEIILDFHQETDQTSESFKLSVEFLLNNHFVKLDELKYSFEDNSSKLGIPKI